ncbi:MAG: RNA polymerase sigma factor, partial [Clostridiales bacterium]|nr:RNA polymerase sigma factor [Clostridiales bacterium]
FRGDAQFSTWLYKIAVRVCLDALRKRRQTVSLDLLSESGWEVPDGAPELYEQLEKGERRRLLRDAIGQLPADFKAPQVLVDLQGLSYEEAADVLGLPLGTVKSRVYRARRILLRILSQSGELFLRDGRPKGEGRED